MKGTFYISILVLSACSTVDPSDKHENMVLVEEGNLQFGDPQGKENEKPEVALLVPAFYLDKQEVSNAEFQKFVEAENYKTTAEEIGSSMIYSNQWDVVSGIAWNTAPYGEEKLPPKFGELPVVHVSWYDAQAYCKWKQKRLPTEQELEYVIENYETETYNIWEGQYPDKNNMKDGYYWTAPVGSYEPNELGIYDLQGNVWEWTADNYNYNIHDIIDVKSNPSASVWNKVSYDPTHDDPNIEQRVIKGGSFLCHESYCCGYKAAARMPAEPRNSYFHVGFRCACDL